MTSRIRHDRPARVALLRVAVRSHRPARPPTAPIPSDTPSGTLRCARAIRDLLRAPATPAVVTRKRGAAAARLARAGRARRPPRLRPRVGGRAPLPPGVLAGI